MAMMPSATTGNPYEHDDRIIEQDLLEGGELEPHMPNSELDLILLRR